MPRLALRGFPDASALEIGESVAVNGVCLTVRTRTAEGFVADLSRETLARTTLGALRSGDLVNLERSLRLGDRLGGHFVFGHVDAVGEIRTLAPEGDGQRLVVRVPPDFAGFVCDKGSVAVDGISLTMCDSTADEFAVALIPHTVEVTNLGSRRVGDRVNLEADMLARYARAAIDHFGRSVATTEGVAKR